MSKLFHADFGRLKQIKNDFLMLKTSIFEHKKTINKKKENSLILSLNQIKE